MAGQPGTITSLTRRVQRINPSSFLLCNIDLPMSPRCTTFQVENHDITSPPASNPLAAIFTSLFRTCNSTGPALRVEYRGAWVSICTASSAAGGRQKGRKSQRIGSGLLATYSFRMPFAKGCPPTTSHGAVGTVGCGAPVSPSFASA